MLMMNSKLIYSNLFSLEPSANNARNSNNIWETQPETVGAGAPGKQIVLQRGEMGGACKEMYETPKSLSRLLIAKRN